MLALNVILLTMALTRPASPDPNALLNTIVKQTEQAFYTDVDKMITHLGLFDRHFSQTFHELSL